MICRRYTVTGRVQGVFFRASTQQSATELNLLGWVRNLHDGRVEILATGNEEQMQHFENWLENGPELAKVSNIEVINENLEENMREFADVFEIKATTRLP